MMVRGRGFRPQPELLAVIYVHNFSHVLYVPDIADYAYHRSTSHLLFILHPYAFSSNDGAYSYIIVMARFECTSEQCTQTANEHWPTRQPRTQTSTRAEMLIRKEAFWDRAPDVKGKEIVPHPSSRSIPHSPLPERTHDPRQNISDAEHNQIQPIAHSGYKSRAKSSNQSDGEQVSIDTNDEKPGQSSRSPGHTHPRPLNIPCNIEAYWSPPGQTGYKEPTKKHNHSEGEQVTIATRDDKQGYVSKLTDQRIDGLLTPESGDLTVHLELDLQQDLEDQIEELARLSRLGQFAAAKDLLEGSLQWHLENPYVLVQHAGLLLQQGKFRSVTLLRGDLLRDLETKSPDSKDLHLLRINWDLMQLSAKRHTLEALGNVSALFEEVAQVLDGLTDARSVGSIEVSI